MSWRSTGAHNDTRLKRPGGVRDILQFYTRGESWTWNPIFVPYSGEHIERKFRHVDVNGRRYGCSDLTAARGGDGLSYEFHGRKPYRGRSWAYSRENMEKFLREGRLLFPESGGAPVLKQYLDEMPGVALQNDWPDIGPVSGRERLGYPTQKPVALLERILTLSSNRGDLVLDPFCGCCTTIHAAQKLGRRWIGIDSSQPAISLASRRMRDAFPDADFKVTGVPADAARCRRKTKPVPTNIRMDAPSACGS